LNPLITGPTGTGKSLLASAFAYEVCVRGYRVRYCRVSRLLKQISIGLANAKYEKMLDDLKEANLLILDDFGLERIDVSASRDLLEIIDDRYPFEKSVLFTAQLPVNKWVSVFHD